MTTKEYIVAKLQDKLAELRHERREIWAQPEDCFGSRYSDLLANQTEIQFTIKDLRKLTGKPSCWQKNWDRKHQLELFEFCVDNARHQVVYMRPELFAMAQCLLISLLFLTGCSTAPKHDCHQAIIDSFRAACRKSPPTHPDCVWCDETVLGRYFVPANHTATPHTSEDL
jgi:hypothetical protein